MNNKNIQIDMPKAQWADPGREEGFHEGIEFAITYIENPDIPFMALDICKKILLKRKS